MGVVKNFDPIIYFRNLKNLQEDKKEEIRDLREEFKKLLKIDEHYLSQLVFLIKNYISPPFSIAINGAWGSGKTTYLKLLQEQLEDEYEVIWFNPWEYARETHNHIVLSFMKVVASQTEGRIKNFADRFKVFSYSLFLTSLDAIARVLTTGEVSLEKVDNISKMVNDKLQSESEKYEDVIQSIKKEFVGLTKEISKQKKGRPIVVIFDDLDRCLPDDALNYLEAIKNLFVIEDAPVVFVGGINREVARQFIMDKYKGLENRSDFATSYFKKIFNLTLELPLKQRQEIIGIIKKYIEDVFSNTDHLKNDVAILEMDSFSETLSDLLVDAEVDSLRALTNILNQYFIVRLFGKGGLKGDQLLSLLVVREKWSEEYGKLSYKIRQSIGKQLNSCYTEGDYKNLEFIKFVKSRINLDLNIQTILDDYLV